MIQQSRMLYAAILLAILMFAASLSGCSSNDVPVTPLYTTPQHTVITNTPQPPDNRLSADAVKAVFICTVTGSPKTYTMGHPYETDGIGGICAEVGFFKSPATVGSIFLGTPEKDSFCLGYMQNDKEYGLTVGMDYLILSSKASPPFAFIDYEGIYLVSDGKLGKIGSVSTLPEIDGMTVEEALEALNIKAAS